ncbi:MAG: RimK family alpha-L-glutamate ligase [Bdellovibrionota bacterium]
MQPLYYKGETLKPIDCIIPRISPVFAAVLRQLEHQGVFSVNHSTSMNIARDKLRTVQIMSRSGVPVPPSAFVYQDTDVAAAIGRIGGAPVIVKLCDGNSEDGIMLAQSNTTAKAIVETLQVAGKQVLVQKLVSKDPTSEIRVLVVGEHVLAAVKRTESKDDEHTNLHISSVVEKIELEAAFEKAAIRAVRVMGLRVASVDLIESETGPVVIEIDPCPEIDLIEKITGVDLAGQIIDYLDEHKHFPDLNIRERLYLAKGFGVVEILVAEGSMLDGKTFNEAELKENGIRPLGITRKKRTILNPKYDFKISAGDLILCFGKLDKLKQYLIN